MATRRTTSPIRSRTAFAAINMIMMASMRRWPVGSLEKFKKA
jgi:hypothetical protein